MKIVIGCLFLMLSVSSFGQVSLPELDRVMRQGDSTAIRNWVEGNNVSFRNVNRNDTLRQIWKVSHVIFEAYQKDQLNGYSNYQKDIEGRRILIQPEVQVSFIPEIDYRGIFARKYISYSLMDSVSPKRGRWDWFVSLYSEIPGTEVSLKYPIEDFRSEVKVDTAFLSAVEDYLTQNGETLDQEAIRKVLNVRFGKYQRGKREGKFFALLSYNLWIDKIIFNNQMDQCLVQFSTIPSNY